MKVGHKIFLLVLLITFSYLLLKPSLSIKQTTPPPPLKITTAEIPAATSSAETLSNLGICHIKGVLPDSTCTPGTIDSNVTQENIFKTICVKGYTQTVRPPVSYTNKLKLQQITDYGYADKNPKSYEEDHLISLELGGSPTDPKNLWPEPGSSPNLKDKIENLCHSKICSKEITLSQAQSEIATNWQTACQ